MLKRTIDKVDTPTDPSPKIQKTQFYLAPDCLNCILSFVSDDIKTIYAFGACNTLIWEVSNLFSLSPAHTLTLGELYASIEFKKYDFVRAHKLKISGMQPINQVTAYIMALFKDPEYKTSELAEWLKLKNISIDRNIMYAKDLWWFRLEGCDPSNDIIKPKTLADGYIEIINRRPIIEFVKRGNLDFQTNFITSLNGIKEDFDIDFSAIHQICLLFNRKEFPVSAFHKIGYDMLRYYIKSGSSSQNLEAIGIIMSSKKHSMHEILFQIKNSDDPYSFIKYFVDRGFMSEVEFEPHGEIEGYAGKYIDILDCFLKFNGWNPMTINYNCQGVLYHLIRLVCGNSITALPDVIETITSLINHPNWKPDSTQITAHMNSLFKSSTFPSSYHESKLHLLFSDHPTYIQEYEKQKNEIEMQKNNMNKKIWANLTKTIGLKGILNHNNK
jgi:uncharacterized protein (UPF0297 family)